MAQVVSDKITSVGEMKRSHYGMIINGERVESVSGEVFETFNPAKGEVIATIAKAQIEDAERAVQAARNSFDN